MLVVEPRGARFDEAVVTSIGEEHLLERVSALENNLARLTEKVGQALELLLRQARSSHIDHLAVQSLVSVLTDARILSKGPKATQRTRVEPFGNSADESVRLTVIKSELAAKAGESWNARLRTRVRKGVELADAGQYRAALSALVPVSKIAPSAGELSGFIGEIFFRLGEMEPAREYLAAAAPLCKDRAGLALLFGLASGECGRAVESRRWLLRARKLGCRASALSFGLGMLAMTAMDAQLAKAEFRRCSSRSRSMASFGFAKLYYYQGRPGLCLRRLDEMLVDHPGNKDLIELKLAAIRAQRGPLQPEVPRNSVRKARHVQMVKNGREGRFRFRKRDATPVQRLISADSDWAKMLVLEDAVEFLSEQTN